MFDSQADGFAGDDGPAESSLASPAGGPAPAKAMARTRRIAILGFSETVKDAPFADPSWEVWAMNGFWRAAKPDFGIDVPEERYSLWFDMHTLDYTREYGKRAGFGDQQERWLERPHPFPIFMLDEPKAFPSVRRFPIEDVVALAGRDYFTSTVAYALVFALIQPDVAEIGVWGIDLAHDSEYADQRPCAEYWIGRAEAMGIKVTIHERSALLRQRYRYGYEDDNPLLAEIAAGIQQQMDACAKKVTELRTRNEALVAEMHTNDGAFQAMQALLQRLEIYRRGGRI